MTSGSETHLWASSRLLGCRNLRSIQYMARAGTTPIAKAVPREYSPGEQRKTGMLSLLVFRATLPLPVASFQGVNPREREEEGSVFIAWTSEHPKEV